MEINNACCTAIEHSGVETSDDTEDALHLLCVDECNAPSEATV